MFDGVRFLWAATRGYRLRPSSSPYLRWRLETYTGKPAGEVRLPDFLRLAWGERWQILRFRGWLAELRSLTRTVVRDADK